MKKVRYIYKGIFFDNLTNGKIYDVIRFKKDKVTKYQDLITVINDIGLEETFVFRTPSRDLFKNATAEYRNKIIKEILK